MFSKKLFLEGALVSISDYFLFAANFLIIFLINHFLGAVQVGIYSTALATSQIFYLTFGTPLGLILRRELIVKPKLNKKLVNCFSSYKLVLFTLVSTILFVLFIFYRTNLYQTIFVYFLIKGVEFLADTFLVYFQGLQKFKTYSILKIFYGLFSILILLLLNYNISIFVIYWILFILSIFYLGCNIIFYYFINGWPKFNFDLQMLNFVKKESWPLFINAVLFQVSNKGNIIILSIFLSSMMIGQYSLGLSIVAALSAFMSSVALVIFPNLTHIYMQDKTKFVVSIEGLIKKVFFLGLGIVFFYNLLINPVNKYILYWQDDVVLLTRIMSISIIPLLMIGVVGNLFSIIYEQKQGLYVAIIVMIVTLLINLIFGYSLNLNFVGLGYVLCSFFNYFLYFFWFKKLINKQIKAKVL